MQVCKVAKFLQDDVCHCLFEVKRAQTVCSRSLFLIGSDNRDQLLLVEGNGES